MVLTTSAAYVHTHIILSASLYITLMNCVNCHHCEKYLHSLSDPYKEGCAVCKQNNVLPAYCTSFLGYTYIFFHSVLVYILGLFKLFSLSEAIPLLFLHKCQKWGPGGSLVPTKFTTWPLSHMYVYVNCRAMHIVLSYTTSVIITVVAGCEHGSHDKEMLWDG